MKLRRKRREKRERTEKQPPVKNTGVGGFMLSPPRDCPYAITYKEQRMVDMTLCAFVCENPCSRFIIHQSTFGKTNNK